MPQGGMGVALQSSRTTAHCWILGGCDHATWPMVSIEKSDATGGIQRAPDRLMRHFLRRGGTMEAWMQDIAPAFRSRYGWICESTGGWHAHKKIS